MSQSTEKNEKPDEEKKIRRDVIIVIMGFIIFSIMLIMIWKPS